jgi:hypothetical protein
MVFWIDYGHCSIYDQGNETRLFHHHPKTYASIITRATLKNHSNPINPKGNRWSRDLIGYNPQNPGGLYMQHRPEFILRAQRDFVALLRDLFVLVHKIFIPCYLTVFYFQK